MILATKWEDIENNLVRLLEYRNSHNREELEFYLGLIKRGRCFVIYKHDSDVLCGPSRFVGYADNNLHAHLANKSRDGTITNAALENIFGHPPVENETAEKEYRKLCAHLGMKPSAGKRKYWVKS